MIGWYMFWALIVDIFIKGSSVAISTFLIVYIFVKGSGDWSLLWLAFSNIGLFTGFGLVSLSKIYEKYIEKHLPAVIQRTIRLQEQAIEKERLEKEKEKEILEKEKEKELLHISNFPQMPTNVKPPKPVILEKYEVPNNK